MIGSIRITSFILSLMMATSAMSAPAPGIPGIPGVPGLGLPGTGTGTGTGVGTPACDTAAICRLCKGVTADARAAEPACQPCGNLAEPKPVPAPTIPSTCDNKGLAYAVQGHTFENTDKEYTNLKVDFFKTAKPGQTGYTKKIGFTNTDTYTAVNHRAYIVPKKTGTYKIVNDGADDAVLVWFKEKAFNGGYTRENADLIQLAGQSGQVAFTIDLEAGKYYPFRALVVNAQGGSLSKVTFTGPDGEVIISSTTETSDYFVQYSCDGTYPAFQPFGEEK